MLVANCPSHLYNMTVNPTLLRRHYKRTALKNTTFNILPKSSVSEQHIDSRGSFATQIWVATHRLINAIVSQFNIYQQIF